MNKIKTLWGKPSILWNKLPDNIKRVIHTFWQTFVAVFLMGITPILKDLLNTHNISGAETAFTALIGAALASAASAVKAWWVASRNGN